MLAEANTAAANIASHQVAGDPHGDRAYALALVAPLTSGVNGPNGFLQLNSIGKIPTAQLPPGGGRTSAFDVVKDYSAPVNGTAASSFIQSALNDCRHGRRRRGMGRRRHLRHRRDAVRALATCGCT